MTDIPPEETRKCIIDLIEWWDDSATSVQLDSVRQGAGVIIHGLTSHCHRLAEGIVTLYDTDNDMAMMPLVRQLIETGFRIVWLGLYPDDATALVAEGIRHDKNVTEYLTRSGALEAESPDHQWGFSKYIEFARQEMLPVGRNFEKCCHEIEGGDVVYGLYRVASGMVHPTGRLAEHYVGSHDQHENSIILRTRPTLPPRDAWMGTSLSMLIHACLTWDRFSNSYPKQAELKALANRLDIKGKPRMTGEGFSRHNADQTRRRRAKKEKPRSRRPG